MLKRVFDFVCASIGLLLLSPVFGLIGLWIQLDSSGPIFYRQSRVGRYGRSFRIHKFRTMAVNSDSQSRLTVGADRRITRSGAFLRKYKLDELPQLIDVLLGDMSLVGPRPEVKEFIDCYPADVRQKVLSVRPGITDRASIEMVDENELLAKYVDPHRAYVEEILPIKQKYYLTYVEQNGFFDDLCIIGATVRRILFRASDLKS